MYSNSIRTYKKTTVVTANPGRLVIMCYDGAIDQLNIAKQRYAEKEYKEKARAIDKAEDIIDELLCSLDLERGGAIARNLESLYNYIIRRILQADVDGNLEVFDEVIGILTELKSAWETVVGKPSVSDLSDLTQPGEGPGQALGDLSV